MLSSSTSMADPLPLGATSGSARTRTPRSWWHEDSPSCGPIRAAARARGKRSSKPWSVTWVARMSTTSSAVSQAMIDRGVTEPGRVGITGNSYGGYMAAWIPCWSDVFAASVSRSPVTDWRSQHLTGNLAEFDEIFVSGDPFDPESAYVDAEPTHAPSADQDADDVHRRGARPRDACVASTTAASQHCTRPECLPSWRSIPRKATAYASRMRSPTSWPG